MGTQSFHVAFILFVFLATSGTLGCDPDTGPAGVTECVLGTPYYSKYQCATCLTNAYIKQRSHGKHACRNSTRTYCYYQCMIDRYGIDEGPVYDTCLCEANTPLPQPSIILPSTCYSPDGTDCGWYRQCLAKRFPCTGHQAEYAISYGEKFCNLYTHSPLEFSPKALEWINATRKCLQVALVPLLHLCRVQPTCDDISEMAFESHVPCYVRPYQGFSVCTLSPADWARIFWTIKSSFLPGSFLETLKASLVTAANCPGVWSKALAKKLFSIGVRVWNLIPKIRSKRAAADTLSDDELAHAVVLDISSSLRWSEESTILWYAFAVNTSDVQQPTAVPGSDQPDRELIIQVIAAFVTPPPTGERSIVMSVFVCVCVCVCVCLSVRDHISGTTRPIFTKFLCMLPMAVARSSCDGVVIRYVLPVLWMTSYLLMSQGCSTSPPS